MAYGDGSIYRRSQDGKWVAAVDVTESGGPRRQKRRVRATREEAEAALAELQEAHDLVPGPRWHVDAETGCWNWAGGQRPDGYCQVTVNYRKVLAHRLVYEEQVGPIPDDLVCDHLCRNRRCVNPEHIELTTAAENTRRGVTAYLRGEDDATVWDDHLRPYWQRSDELMSPAQARQSRQKAQR